MSSPRITYAARQDATRETEMAVLASIYRLALNSAGRDAAGMTSTNQRHEREKYGGGEQCRTVESSLSSGSDPQTTERKTRKK